MLSNTRRTMTRFVGTAVIAGAMAAAMGLTTATAAPAAAEPTAPVPTANTDTGEDPFATGEVIGLRDLQDSEMGIAADGPTIRPPVAFSGAPELPARYVGQATCDPVARPGTTALRNAVLSTIGVGYDGGVTRACSIGGRSEHKEGRAWDWMINAKDPSQKATADSFLAWLVGIDGTGVRGGNAHRLGIMYVIFNGRTWASYSPTWKAYTGSNPHTDHIHLSLSWDGAMKRTSWWTGKTMIGTDYGPCQPYIGAPVPRYTTRNPSPCPEPSNVNPGPAIPVRGDWDGNGQDDVGWFQEGVFWLRGADGTSSSFSFGRAGDVPVVGDWDDNGTDTVGVFREGRWHLRNANSAGAAWRSYSFGRSDDRPVVGRWDETSGTGVGVYRDGAWYLRRGVDSGTVTSAKFGRADDVPVVGDWDGDEVTTPGVRRDGKWFITASVTDPVAVSSFSFGNQLMDALPGDWDGDGDDTVGVVKGFEFHLASDNVAGASVHVIHYVV